MIRIFLVLAVVVSLLGGCSNTTVQTEWKDPGYSGHRISSMLVVGIPANSMIGNQCTDEFIRQLNERGIPAAAGYNTVDAGASRQSVAAKARELGRDGVLVCRFIERKSQLDVYPRNTDSMLIGPEMELWPPNEYVENEYDVFRTILYDAATGKALWSAVSDTFVARSEKKVLQSYVKSMLKKMEDQGLLNGGKR